MRKFDETKRLDSARNRSTAGIRKETIVLKNNSKREFFKFEKGQLVEYDLTKYNNRRIVLEEEEKQGIKQVSKENL